jgi:hypothetical protein
MKLNITLDGKKYEVEVEAVEPTAPAPLMRPLAVGSAGKARGRRPKTGG